MRIVFMYSGQGAQFPGMMRDICETYRESRQVIDIADKVLKRDIKGLMFSGTEGDLQSTHNTQPCVLAADLAAAEALKENGINPDAVAGFSLGEYAALVESNALRIEDAFRIIQIRADAMQDAVPEGEGKMAAIIGVDSDKVDEICEKITDDYVRVANYNSLDQTVISGKTSGVNKVLQLAKAEGIKCVELSVSAPFHCSLMKPAAERVRESVEKCQIDKPNIPVYMNVTSRPFADEANLADMLYRQAMSPVLWKQTLQKMFEDGYEVFIECGPGKTLYNLARKTLDKDRVKILRVSDCKTLEQTVQTIREL